jgi:hypothetical protein
MGRRVADRPDWFDNDEPVDTETAMLPMIEEPEQHWVEPEYGPGVYEYQPHGHTGTDYAVHSRREHRHAETHTRNTDMTLAIIFGIAIGFFMASIIYVMRYHHTTIEQFRDASIVFSGAGTAISGIVAISIAVIHLWRTRKDR